MSMIQNNRLLITSLVSHLTSMSENIVEKVLAVSRADLVPVRIILVDHNCQVSLQVTERFITKYFVSRDKH